MTLSLSNQTRRLAPVVVREGATPSFIYDAIIRREWNKAFTGNQTSLKIDNIGNPMVSSTDIFHTPQCLTEWYSLAQCGEIQSRKVSPCIQCLCFFQPKKCQPP